MKLQSQIVVPVQTNKAQVCPHIYDNQPQKKKQKKPRKASAQSRVHSSSIFFSFFLSEYRLSWSSTGNPQEDATWPISLLRSCAAAVEYTQEVPYHIRLSIISHDWWFSLVAIVLLILYSSPTYQFEFCILEGPGYSFRIEGWLPRYMFVI